MTATMEGEVGKGAPWLSVLGMGGTRKEEVGFVLCPKPLLVQAKNQQR